VGIGIGPATIGACRAGLPTRVLPSQDALICDATPSVPSRHLMMAVGAQNYGQNSYRIRQPFDFAGRTGKIVFDAEAYVLSGLIGWVSVEVTEDPINAPSFSAGPTWNNDEGSLIPRNGFQVQFQTGCAGAQPSVGMRMLAVFNNYRESDLAPANTTCVAAQPGQLNRFELRVSQTRIEVYATPSSADGTAFAAPQLLYGTALSLPFTRGYVSVTTHNHASIKYSPDPTRPIDAWVTRWDNVGFDGPVVGGWREVEVPDSLIPGRDTPNRAGDVMSVGYRIADAANGPAQRLVLKNVDLSNVRSAALSLSAWFNAVFTPDVTKVALRYRFNGRAWRERVLTAAEAALLVAPNQQGQLGLMVDVVLADLVQGDNTLEFVTANVDQNYPPVFANIDLILKTP
jgi:hypothetical protein